jgi:hypothetical protein
MTLISSVNKTGLEFPLIVLDKSLTQRRKSKGPTIDPCGTPYFMTPQSGRVL